MWGPSCSGAPVMALGFCRDIWRRSGASFWVWRRNTELQTLNLEDNPIKDAVTRRDRGSFQFYSTAENADRDRPEPSPGPRETNPRGGTLSSEVVCWLHGFPWLNGFPCPAVGSKDAVEALQPFGVSAADQRLPVPGNHRRGLGQQCFIWLWGKF